MPTPLLPDSSSGDGTIKKQRLYALYATKNNWAQGVYIVRMEEDGNAVHTARVTITH